MLISTSVCMNQHTCDGLCFVVSSNPTSHLTTKAAKCSWVRINETEMFPEHQILNTVWHWMLGHILNFFIFSWGCLNGSHMQQLAAVDGTLAAWSFLKRFLSKSKNMHISWLSFYDSKLNIIFNRKNKLLEDINWTLGGWFFVTHFFDQTTFLNELIW